MENRRRQLVEKVFERKLQAMDAQRLLQRWAHFHERSAAVDAAVETERHAVARLHELQATLAPLVGSSNLIAAARKFRGQENVLRQLRHMDAEASTELASLQVLSCPPLRYPLFAFFSQFSDPGRWGLRGRAVGWSSAGMPLRPIAAVLRCVCRRA
jgi:hypothetical protein